MKNCPKCKEIVGDNVDSCFNCGYNFITGSSLIGKEKKAHEEERKRIDEIVEKNKYDIINKNPRYEYKTVCILDGSDGRINKNEFDHILAKYAAEGWHLQTILSNELGKNSVSILGMSTNATIEEHLLIFERIIYKGEL